MEGGQNLLEHAPQIVHVFVLADEVMQYDVWIVLVGTLRTKKSQGN